MVGGAEQKLWNACTKMYFYIWWKDGDFVLGHREVQGAGPEAEGLPDTKV